MKILKFPDAEDIGALGFGQLAGQFPQDFCSLRHLLAQLLNCLKYPAQILGGDSYVCKIGGTHLTQEKLCFPYQQWLTRKTP